MSTPDITIRGAGIFGLATAFACAKAGARVTVVDPHGVGAGASGGVVGALSPHAPGPGGQTDLKEFQLQGLIAQPAFWAGVAAAGGGSADYARIGRLQPLVDEAGVAQARARAGAAAALWPDGCDWSVRALGADWGLTSQSGMVVHDTLSARLNPRAALAALAAALTALGGRIVPDAPDRGRVLHATGAAGLADLSRHFATDIGRPVKGQAARLGFDGRGLPQVYADGLYLVPHEDGTTAIGSTSETAFDTPGPDALLDDLIARARALAPVLQDAPVIERWSGLRPRARTRQPLLGPWPGRPGHFIANGGFKIGFGLAPVVAETMADLILHDRQGFPETCLPRVALVGPR